MRILTVVNTVLWLVLLVMWIPYVMGMGFADPVSIRVMTILAITGALMACLVAYRVRRHRPILG